MVAVVGGNIGFSISDSTEFLDIGYGEISEDTFGEISREDSKESFGINSEEIEGSGAVEEGSEISNEGKPSFLKKYSKSKKSFVADYFIT